jgi:predicted small lipoprotein YifL
VGRNIDRWNRAALVVALGTGLALAGCGRKSGLDTPSAALAAQQRSGGTASSPAQEPNVLGSLFGGPQAPPPAPAAPAGTPPPKKTFFLDPVIGK